MRCALCNRRLKHGFVVKTGKTYGLKCAKKIMKERREAMTLLPHIGIQDVLTKYC